MNDNSQIFNMQITLEEHLCHMSMEYDSVKDIYGLWLILKKDLETKMNNANFVFPFYSKHDYSHSTTLVNNIELFLGSERIERLSPTDTFMLLVCAYSHDYGMAISLEDYYLLLKDDDNDFKRFLKKTSDSNKCSKILLNLVENNNQYVNLEEIFIALVSIIPEFIRPNHWKGVERIEEDFKGIFKGRLKNRFVHSIISMCQIHGKSAEDILLLSQRATGIISDVFHPRFIAAMIRLGDLLDLDNGRFSNDFETYYQYDSFVPELSKIHYLKHEAISHFFINQNNIEVEAHCNGEFAEQVARVLMNWINWLDTECRFLNKEWNNIVPHDFGFSPRLSYQKIFVEGNEYQSSLNSLKMELPGDKIFDLLRGCNVYKTKFVAFREILQNAIDATLIQAYQDYSNFKKSNITLEEYCIREKNKYSININIIEDIKNNCVFVEFIDRGIGIDDEDLNYMCQIGAGNISNPSRNKIIIEMPKWFKPSGMFGIGLQSAFQITEKIEFYTKKRNRTPRRISFSSYALNTGYIEVSKCTSSHIDMFEKLSNQGTLVRLKIEPNSFKNDTDFDFFDREFNESEPEKYLHLLWIEISNQIEKLRAENRVNYFPVEISSITSEGQTRKTSSIKCFKPFYSSIHSQNHIIWNVENWQVFLDYWYAPKGFHLHIIIPLNRESITSSNEPNLRLLDKAFSIKYKFQKIGDFSNLYATENENAFTQMLESNINLIQCTVNIFDDNVEKYINIDRNILKSDSLKFKDIINAEIEAFTELCKFMCEKNLFKTKLSLLVDDSNFSLAFILLYRFSSKEQFAQFKSIFSKNFSLAKINFSPEKSIAISDIIKKGVLIAKKIPIKCQDTSVKTTRQDFIEYEKTKNYLPKHYLMPQKIELVKRNSEMFVLAKCFIRREYQQKTVVELSNSFLRWQYKLQIDTNFTLLINKALLPDHNFKELFVYKYPKFFTDPFFNIFDEKFSMHILSPFSNKTIEIFKDSVLNNTYEKDKDSFYEKLNEDSHFQKCLAYLRKNAVFPIDINNCNLLNVYFNYIDKLAQLLNSSPNPQ